MKSTARRSVPLASPQKKHQSRLWIWVLVTALVAACSCVAYELLLASYATFLMGASVFQYSLVISIMMTAMGVGALLSAKTASDPLLWLVRLEWCLGATATIAIPVLYTLFAIQGPAQIALWALVALMGVILGLEIPLLNQLEKNNRWLEDILFYDYVGGFLGGLLFPFVLLPALGFFRVAALLGLINVALGLVFWWHCRSRWRHPVWTGLGGVSLFVACCVALVWGEQWRAHLETLYFGVRHAAP